MSDTHHHPGTEEDSGPSYYARRGAAIEALLVEKGYCTAKEIEREIHKVESRSPADGARVVARAWTDPEFKQRLLADPKSALTEMGYTPPDNATDLTVFENTEEVHHLVVCTLCSCYPRSLLGRPPDWYKSFAYRSRAVVEPRSVMREFGFDPGESVEVRVLDSTADLRYLVLPLRPAGSEGLSEQELVKLVSRDSMIGVTAALSPEVSPVAG